jgi:DNA-binding CsgD family transcriptional regulator
MNHDQSLGESRFPIVLAVLLLAVSVFGVVDLVLDAPDGVLSLHVLVELGFVLFCLVTAVYLGRGWYAAKRSIHDLERAMSEHKAERDAWRKRAKKLLDGLGEAIDRQMQDWNLTPVERETALYLLKGFSHKEIAHLEGKSERTVRQHSISIYKKSGLSGRAELSAFFLEDLLLPNDGTTGVPRSDPPSQSN